jgi:outer membrane protein TolC
MATIRQIIHKALELKGAVDLSQELQVQRDNTATQLASLETRLSAAQTQVQRLRNELQALINEP